MAPPPLVRRRDRALRAIVRRRARCLSLAPACPIHQLAWAPARPAVDASDPLAVVELVGVDVVHSRSVPPAAAAGQQRTVRERGLPVITFRQRGDLECADARAVHRLAYLFVFE